MLNKEDLLSLGYTFHISDFKRPYFVTPDDDASVDYATEAITVEAASLDAIKSHTLSRCDNCGKLHSEDTLVEARHLSMRTEPGGTIPSGECVDCGALCYPLKNEDLTELAPSNHDTSVMARVIQSIDWTQLAKQKQALVELTKTVCQDSECHLDGIIHLLDALQDAAEDDGLYVSSTEDGSSGQDEAKPNLKWFAVTGRIPGDDEDSCHVFHLATREDALNAFADAMWEGETEIDRDSVMKEHGQPVFWNSIVASDTPITEM